MNSETRISRWWAVPTTIGIGAFSFAMLSYASLGSTVPETYSSIMLQAYPLILGTLTLWDILARRKYKDPVLVIGFIVFLNCFVSLRFVNNLWFAYSMGFVSATIGVTFFLCVFAYVVFFTEPMKPSA
jgi:hypothetical protein